MSDRERLEGLSRERALAREKANKEEERNRQDEAQSIAIALETDKQKTEEIYSYCKREFQGFELADTKHVIGVSKTYCSTVHKVEARDVQYVCLSTMHRGIPPIQGEIPLLLARHRHSKYHVVGVDRKQYVVDSFDELRDTLIGLLADLDREAMRRLLQRIT